MKKQQNDNHPVEPRLVRWFFNFIIIFTTLILGWTVLLFVGEGINIQPMILTLPLFMVIIAVVILFYHQNYLKLIRWIKQKFPRLTLTKLLKYVLVATTIVGIVARLGFLAFSDSHDPKPQLGDSGIHWNVASRLVNGEELSAYEGQYEAFYPHLMTYTAVLAFFMKICGVNYFAVLLLNLLFDIIGVLAIYFLLRFWRGRNVAQIGAIIWILNPLEIMYCAVSMPIVATNAILALALLVGYIVLRTFKQKLWWQFALLMCLLGIIISVGNGFRPFFTVFLIAITMVLVAEVIRKGKSFCLPAIAGLALAVISCMGNNQLLDLGYQKMNPYHVPGGVGVGWNFYVGANFESWGRWNVEDYNWWRSQIYGNSCTDFEEFKYETYDCIEEHGDLAGLQSELLSMSFSRYAEMSLPRLIRHLVHKTDILLADSDTIITWLVESIHIKDDDPYYRAANTIGVCLLVGCLVLALKFFIDLFWQHSLQFNDYLLFFALCFCGIVAVSLMVEVMHRYVMPITVFFMMFASCELVNLYQKYVTMKPKSGRKL